jgi:DNA-binding transcriptional regulator YiaG
MTTTLLDEAIAEAQARRELPDPTEARRLRQRAGLTQQQIAEAIGVSRFAVCHWETGVRQPRGPAARLYLAVLRRLVAEHEREGPRSPP